MPATDLPFSATEYARRLEKVRAAMASRGLDVLFIEDPSNMAWLTGYDGWSFYVHQGVLIFHDRDPMWWGRGQDAQGAIRTVWMADENCVGYPDNFVQSTERHAMQHLARIITDLGFGTAQIGVELDNYYFSAKAYLSLVESLPDARFRDATALVNWQRTVKSDEELVFMRRAARISEAIVDGILERAEPGLAKNLLVADIFKTAVSGLDVDGETIWGDYAAIVPLLPSGSDAAASHLTWDGRPLKSGEATFFEISGCYRRYHAPLCRTIYFGTPPDFMTRAADALVEGLNGALQAARAGNRASDVAHAIATALEKAGIERSARAGYPVGLSYPPDWGERTISIREEDDTVLEAGMTFHLMPGLWMGDWGLEITESILIRDGAPAECLCDRPRKLFVKP
ncbi:MAG: M24 family metallopeptidase [Pseudomonadota bacterium]